MIKVSGLPVRARLAVLDSWRLTKDERSDGPFFGWERSERGERTKLINAWKVRDSFLAVQTAQDAWSFCEEFGPFIRNREPAGRVPHTEKSGVSFATIQKYQEWFLSFITEPSPSWAEGKTHDMTTFEGAEGAMRVMSLNCFDSPEFAIRMGHVPVKGRKIPAPFLDSESNDVNSAVYASIYLDKMRGLDGRVCKREDCRRTFLAQDPRKEFCSASCSAAIRVQKSRNAKEATNAKSSR